MSKLSKRIGIWSTLACVALLAPSAGYAAVEFGKQGEPVKLVVGYQPYYTESWSGVVINGKQLWKKYLPPGSTVEFQVGLQGAIIVNAMTGEKQHIGYVGDMPGIVSTFRNPGYRFRQLEEGSGPAQKVTCPVSRFYPSKRPHMVEGSSQKETRVEVKQLWLRDKTAICEIPRIDQRHYVDSFSYGSETAGHLKGHEASVASTA